jgi:hypothetical protein
VGGREGGKEGGRVVTVNPMEIRTFEVVLGWRKEGVEEEGGREGGEERGWMGPGGFMEVM